MTDWMGDMQAGVDRWLSAQRDLWSSLMSAGTGPRGMEDVQRRAVEMWRQATYGIVDAQAEALLGLLKHPQGTDAEALLRRSTEAQREMWDGWLGALGKSGAGGAPDIAAAGEQLAGSLRGAAEQLIRSQAEWAKAWSKAGDAGPPDAA
jgi:hypothetical protein